MLGKTGWLIATFIVMSLAPIMSHAGQSSYPPSLAFVNTELPTLTYKPSEKHLTAVLKTLRGDILPKLQSGDVSRELFESYKSLIEDVAVEVDLITVIGQAMVKPTEKQMEEKERMELVLHDCLYFLDDAYKLFSRYGYTTNAVAQIPQD